MQPKTVTQELLARLHYWENELDFDRSAHPEPAARLDSMFEQFIEDEATAMLRLSDAKEEIARLKVALEATQKVLVDQIESVQSVMARNKSLENRWTQLRKLLGIEQGREDWS